MNKEILHISEQLKDAYEGDPWFGRSAKALLAEVDEKIAFEKVNGQHCLVELLWHMITWREFTISRLQPDRSRSLQYFEQNDWRELDRSERNLWHKGLHRLDETQALLIAAIEKRTDDLLEQTVPQRQYNYRKLLYGIIQHDIYHLGQIAYIVKALRSK